MENQKYSDNDYGGLDTPETVPSRDSQYTNQVVLPAISEERQRSIKIKGYMTIVGAICIEMFIGCFFLWGNISVYVLSYYHEQNPDLSYGFVFYVDTILVGFNCLGYQIGTFMLQKLRWNPKIILTLGAGMALTALFMASFAKELWLFMTLYGAVNGIGCGMCYMVPLVCSWEYFPKKQGMITGIIVGSYGFASFVFGLISTAIVNPNNINPTIDGDNIKFFTPEVADRVPLMMRTLVFIWFAFALLSVMLISRRPKDSIERESEQEQEEYARPVESIELPVNESESPEQFNAGQPGDEIGQEYELKSVKYCWLSIRFWQCFMMMVLANFFGTFFSYTFKGFAEDDTVHPQINDRLMSVAASVGGGLINGATRITMGSLTDKYSFKLLFGIMMMVQLFNSVVCYWAANSPTAFFICVMLNYFSLGGLFAVFPGTVVRTFGKEQGPSVYVLVLIGSFCSSALNIFNTKFLLPATGFLFVYLVGAATTILTLVTLYFYEEKLDVVHLAKYNALVKIPGKYDKCGDKTIDTAVTKATE